MTKTFITYHLIRPSPLLLSYLPPDLTAHISKLSPLLHIKPQLTSSFFFCLLDLSIFISLLGQSVYLDFLFTITVVVVVTWQLLTSFRSHNPFFYIDTCLKRGAKERSCLFVWAVHFLDFFASGILLLYGFFSWNFCKWLWLLSNLGCSWSRIWNCFFFKIGKCVWSLKSSKIWR